MRKGEGFMAMAIRKAVYGVKQENSPFGSCIVKDGKIIASAHNTVLREHDPTNHAEMNAIRRACKRLKSHKLRGCTVYSTTEPCPMCFTAIHWAKADAIVYGTSIADVKKLGFKELTISNRKMKKVGRSKIMLKGGFMREECLGLLRFWKDRKGKTY